MFADLFFPQLLFFLLGQAAAFGLLRTGMLVLGFAGMILGWVLGDLALVLHFLYPEKLMAYRLSLWGLQALALTSFFLFFGWRWLRRSAGFRSRQERFYKEALDHFMAGRDEKARDLFRHLSRRDPWDVEALLFLGRLEGVRQMQGASPRRLRRKALRLMGMSARLSGERPIRREIEEEIRCLKRRAKTQPPESQEPQEPQEPQEMVTRPEPPRRGDSRRKAAS